MVKVQYSGTPVDGPRSPAGATTSMAGAAGPVAGPGAIEEPDSNLGLKLGRNAGGPGEVYARFCKSDQNGSITVPCNPENPTNLIILII